MLLVVSQPCSGTLTHANVQDKLCHTKYGLHFSLPAERPLFVQMVCLHPAQMCSVSFHREVTYHSHYFIFPSVFATTFVLKLFLCPPNASVQSSSVTPSYLAHYSGQQDSLSS